MDTLEKDKLEDFRQRRLKANRKYREKNRERLNREQAAARKKNGRDDAEYQREWRRRKTYGLPPPAARVFNGIDKKRTNETKRKYYAKHKDHIARQRKAVHDADPERVNGYSYAFTARHRGTGDRVDMATLLRARLKTIRRTGGNKIGRSAAYLGCSYDQWMNHLGPGAERMKELNLHIDHVWPVALYDLTDPAEQFKCFNYLNTQLLTEAANREKGGKVPSKEMALKVPRHLWPKAYADYYKEELSPGMVLTSQTMIYNFIAHSSDTIMEFPIPEGATGARVTLEYSFD